MPERYFSLAPEKQIELLKTGSDQYKRLEHILEKDIWIVWTLEALFNSGLKDDITFKGGTSLVKAFKCLDRFSEDVDLTYDIRRILHDKDLPPNALPPTSSQAHKWTNLIHDRLPPWIRTSVIPRIEEALKMDGLFEKARLNISGDHDETLILEYDPHFGSAGGYVKPEIKLEFGARGTGEPWELLPVACDLAPLFPQVAFPNVVPRVMRVERTFWEKVTALHSFCLQDKERIRFFRHWHDVAVLSKSERITNTFLNKTWLARIAAHKSRFFPEKDRNGNRVLYDDCLTGNLKLVPDDKMLAFLKTDYEQMRLMAFFRPDAPSFQEIIDASRNLESELNRLYSDFMNTCVADVVCGPLDPRCGELEKALTPGTDAGEVRRLLKLATENPRPYGVEDADLIAWGEKFHLGRNRTFSGPSGPVTKIVYDDF